MAAIWLAVVSPVISQIVIDSSMPSMAAMCGPHRDHPAPAGPHPLSMEKCGYCGLLGHSPALLGDAASLRLPSPPTSRSVVPAPDPIYAKPGVMAASPRVPPII